MCNRFAARVKLRSSAKVTKANSHSYVIGVYCGAIVAAEAIVPREYRHRYRDRMTPLLHNPRFAETYERLASVSLNPRRHTAANAHAHSEAVATRAAALA